MLSDDEKVLICAVAVLFWCNVVGVERITLTRLGFLVESTLYVLLLPYGRMWL